MQVTLEAGHSGQFDIFADDELIAARDSGLLKILLGGGWPSERDVVAKLRERIATT